LDELFEVLTLVQTERIPRFPLILFGTKHWSGLLKWMKAELRERNKFIGPDDLKLVTVTDDVDEAVAVIHEYLQRVGPPQTAPMAFS
jgi:predicted Rossmann-fold nucleotide-binding protein